MKSRWWNRMGLLSLIFLSGCFAGGNRTTWEYMPDMADSPALKAQKYEADLPHHRAMLTPPEGTIPRGYQPYAYKDDPEGAARELQNPLPRTEAVLLGGQKTFNIYCATCHGPKGLGDGSVVPPFPRPPSLQSDKVRTWSDGRIFHVITVGQNLMPSYASQLDPQQRWAVIQYMRALQLAENPSDANVEAYKTERRTSDIEHREKK